MNQKKVWQVTAKLELNGLSAITSAEWQEIRDIAHSCVMRYGRTVYQAATLLSFINETVNVGNNSCAGNTSNVRSKSKGDVISLSPNPTTGKFRLEGITNKASVKVMNLEGMVLRIIETGGYQELDLTELNNGIYFIEIHDYETKESFVKKLIKV